MATKGLKNPFNVCYATCPTSKISSTGVVTPGPNIDYYFQSSRIYEDTEVAKRTGIILVPADQWQGEEPLVKVEQMILSRKVIRLIGEYTLTAGGNRSLSFLVARPKVGDILSDDKAKNLTDQKVLDSKGTAIGKFFNVRTATRNRFS